MKKKIIVIGATGLLGEPVAGGFIPTSLHQAVDYIPTLLELLVSLGIYGIEALILTLLFKLVVGIRNEKKPSVCNMPNG